MVELEVKFNYFETIWRVCQECKNWALDLTLAALLHCVIASLTPVWHQNTSPTTQNNKINTGSPPRRCILPTPAIPNSSCVCLRWRSTSATCVPCRYPRREEREREWSDCTCQLGCWLLIWSFYFQNTAQGKRIRVWLSSCNRETQSKLRDGRGLGVTPDRTSFNHVRVCDCFVHIFGWTGDRSCFCTNCMQQEGFLGGKMLDDSLTEKTKWPYLGGGCWDFHKLVIKFISKSIFCCCCSCRTFGTTWNWSLWKHEHCVY